MKTLEFEIDISFEVSTVTFLYFPPSLPPIQYDVPPSVNPPLLSFGADDITNLESLDHASSVDDMPPFSNVKKDFVYKGIGHSLQNLFMLSVPLKE